MCVPAARSDRAHIGNFAEIKNARLASGVKVGHFSYIGDAAVGEETNIGAGTVTANFDGARKHQTDIGARAFIGSDTILRAPISIGDDAHRRRIGGDQGRARRRDGRRRAGAVDAAAPAA